MQLEAVQKAKLTLRDFNICRYFPLGIRIKKRQKGLFGQPLFSLSANVTDVKFTAILVQIRN